MKKLILYTVVLLIAISSVAWWGGKKSDELRISYKNAYKVNSVCEICDVDSLNKFKVNIEKLKGKHKLDLMFNGEGVFVSLKNIQPTFKRLEIKNNPTDKVNVEDFYGKKIDLLCSSYDLTLSLALYHLKLSNYELAENYLVIALAQEAALSQVLDSDVLFRCHFRYTPRLLNVIAQFCILDDNYINRFVLTPEWRNLSERNCDKEFAKYLNIELVNRLPRLEKLLGKEGNEIHQKNLRDILKVLNAETELPEVVNLSKASKFAQNQELYVRHLGVAYWIYLRAYSQLNVLKVLINASKEKLASGSYPKTTNKKFSNIIDSRGVKIHYSSFESEIPHIFYSLKGTLYGKYVNSLELTVKPKEFWQLEALEVLRKLRIHSQTKIIRQTN